MWSRRICWASAVRTRCCGRRSRCSRACRSPWWVSVPPNWPRSPAGGAGGVEQVALPHGRCEVVTAGDLVLINDTYNANPASFSAALEVARSLRGNRPLVTLGGTMLGLGSEQPALHDQMAEQTT